MESIWDSLKAYGENVLCHCCACTAGQEEVVKLIGFFEGLRKSYTQVRRMILIMSSLPELDKTYQMLIQEEHQSSVGNDTNSTVSESTTLMVQKRKTNYKTN